MTRTDMQLALSHANQIDLLSYALEKVKVFEPNVLYSEAILLHAPAAAIDQLRIACVEHLEAQIAALNEKLEAL